MTERSGTTKGDGVREKIAEQAFGWLLQLDEPDVADSSRAQFAAWLKESPVHVEELLMLEVTWRELGRVARGNTAQTSDLVASSRRNVVPLDVGNAPKPTDLRSVTRLFTRRWLVAAAAAVAMIVTGGLMISGYLGSQPDMYITKLGEQSSFTLTDGSVVYLNTQSKLHIRFTDAERHAELLSGEALFQVAKDPKRPFRVMAADTVVEAIGTRFNVYQNADQTTVTVVEGKVAVRHRNRLPPAAANQAGPVVELPAARVTLFAGEQVAINPVGAITRREVADTQEATAWRQRRLIFKNDSLATIANQFNRYNRLRIEVSGKAAARRLTGVFDADDPESMVEFLIDEPSIRVTRANNRIVISDR